MTRFLLGAALIAVAIPSIGVTLAAQTDSERFNAMLARMWEENLEHNPITATSIGDNRYNDRLPDTTTEAYRAE
ncbi:MAG TPA: DUF885 domain-containing protein, partial [Verrucomicrobiae bacterium]|nr:DUF885 domain-containing protein [Verrucomicrobiae bacterium]